MLCTAYQHRGSLDYLWYTRGRQYLRGGLYVHQPGANIPVASVQALWRAWCAELLCASVLFDGHKLVSAAISGCML